jgi:hypothetical protein
MTSLSFSAKSCGALRQVRGHRLPPVYRLCTVRLPAVYPVEYHPLTLSTQEGLSAIYFLSFDLRYGRKNSFTTGLPGGVYQISRSTLP